MRVPTRPKRLWGLAALALAVWPAGVALAQDLVTRSESGSNKPIGVFADQVRVWEQPGGKVMLVCGHVWISQELVNLKFDEGVLFVDEQDPQGTGTCRLRVYSEGGVLLEEAGERGQRGWWWPPAAQSRATSPDNRSAAWPDDPLVQRAAQVAGSRSVQTAPFPVAPAGPSVAPPVPVASRARGVPDRAGPHRRHVVPAGQPEQGDIRLVGGQSLPEPVPPPPPPAPPEVAPAPRPATPGQPAGLRPAACGRRRAGGRHRAQGHQHPACATTQEIQFRNNPLPNGEMAVIVSSGVILNVTGNDADESTLDIEADRIVFWTKGDTAEILGDLRNGQGQKHRSIEFYLAGHVEIRTKSKKDAKTIRCDEAYYDVNRHVAVALHADLEVYDPKTTTAVHLQSDELFQLNEHQFESPGGQVNASELPYDPNLELRTGKSTLELAEIQRCDDLRRPGLRPQDRPAEHGDAAHVPGRDMRGAPGGRSPIFYLPYIAADVNDPLGPLQNFSVNYNKIYGIQLLTTWDMYATVGLHRTPGLTGGCWPTYMSVRGPGPGHDLRRQLPRPFGIPGNYEYTVRAYGIRDTGTDVIGGNRVPWSTSAARRRSPPRSSSTRATAAGSWPGSTARTCPTASRCRPVSAISDEWFLEQYFRNEFQMEPNQETFAYVKQQQDNWGLDGPGRGAHPPLGDRATRPAAQGRGLRPGPVAVRRGDLERQGQRGLRHPAADAAAGRVRIAERHRDDGHTRRLGGGDVDAAVADHDRAGRVAAG